MKISNLQRQFSLPYIYQFLSRTESHSYTLKYTFSSKRNSKKQKQRAGFILVSERINWREMEEMNGRNAEISRFRFGQKWLNSSGKHLCSISNATSFGSCHLQPTVFPPTPLFPSQQICNNVSLPHNSQLIMGSARNHIFLIENTHDLHS